ncbi:hypothetical protein NERG_00059 [Nematocida ausubeli]|uniref:Uncharacterized protein n=1 Tax=Nematocida ausubeli (strain ATCC PRA-371 / ERTm2) TaxID=1913371 RepID=H8Z8Y8_NEMA1|nr:hypothetical protein NERG_00059 [Nematocida ausubeli]
MTAITKNRTNKIVALAMGIVIAIAFIAIYLVLTKFGNDSSDKDATGIPESTANLNNERLRELKVQKEIERRNAQLSGKKQKDSNKKSNVQPNLVSPTKIKPEPEVKPEEVKPEEVKPEVKPEVVYATLNPNTNTTPIPEQGARARPVARVRPEVADKKIPFMLMRAFNYIYTPIKNGVDSIQKYLYNWYARLRYGANPIVPIPEVRKGTPEVITPTVIEPLV